LLLGVAAIPAMGQSVTRAYSKFDSRQCRHTPGRGVEDYGFWRCAGYAGIEVWLSAGDQRMQVSFGRDAGGRWDFGGYPVRRGCKNVSS